MLIYSDTRFVLVAVLSHELLSVVSLIQEKTLELRNSFTIKFCWIPDVRVSKETSLPIPKQSKMLLADS